MSHTISSCCNTLRLDVRFIDNRVTSYVIRQSQKKARASVHGKLNNTYLFRNKLGFFVANTREAFGRRQVKRDKSMCTEGIR